MKELFYWVWAMIGVLLLTLILIATWNPKGVKWVYDGVEHTLILGKKL